MNTTKCIKCVAAPVGIEGHDELFAQFTGPGRIDFRCRTCGTVWARRYTGDGGFNWTAPASEDLLGVALPGTLGGRAPG
jgi:hypothetical protein